MTARWRESLIRKELRALGPAWLAFATLALLGAALRPGGAFVGYAAGAFFLAALAIGHEYTHRTLPALLAQPVSRRHVFLIKMSVVVVLIMALGAMTSLVDLAGVDRVWHSPAWYARRQPPGLLASLNVGPATALLLPGLTALCLAPWLTMISRGPLGGIVFSAAVVGLAWIGGEVAGALKFGLAPEHAMQVSIFRTQFTWWTMSFVSLAGAVLTWRTFIRLEAIEGASGHVTLRALRQGRDAEAERLPDSRRSWWEQVARKELHLQKMVFVIAGLYLVFWCAIAWSARFSPALPGMLTPVTYLYAGAIALLLGSFASAEERQLGTLHWQVLMPVPAWKPWVVKVLIVSGLCLLLGYALPWMLESAIGLPNDIEGVREAEALPIALIGIAIGSLYISSASTGGLRALVVSLAVAAPVAALGSGLIWVFNTTSRAALPLLRESGWYRGDAFRAVQGLIDPKSGNQIAVIAVLLLMIVLLRLALVNHASADRGLKRVWRQLGWLGVWAVVCTLLIGSLQAATLDDWQTTGASGFRARGHVRFEGSGPQALPDQFYVSVALRPAAGFSPGSGGAWGMIRGDRAFRTSYVMPGSYFVGVGTSHMKPWALKSVIYQGRDISETAIDITADMEDVVVTLSDQLGRIEATVDPNGPDLERAVVYLFPADPALWTDRAVMNRRFSIQTLQSSNYATGVFAFDMPPDGEYLIVALDKYLRYNLGLNAEANARRGGLLAQIAPLATRIQARQGTTIKTTLTVRRQ
jgi:hypothetical protein